MKRITLTIATIMALFLAACEKETIRGHGAIISEARVTGSFHSVKSNADIKVHINYGNIQHVEARGYQNLLAIIETEVINSILTIRYKKEYYNVRNSNVEVFLTIPTCISVSTNGSGDVTVNGFSNDHSLDASINGSSNIYINNSRYNQTMIDVNGSGDVRASGLTTNSAKLSIRGSGDIDIICLDALQARIYGSGDIRYWGNPSLDVEISGSGRVRRQ